MAPLASLVTPMHVGFVKLSIVQRFSFAVIDKFISTRKAQKRCCSHLMNFRQEP